MQSQGSGVVTRTKKVEFGDQKEDYEQAAVNKEALKFYFDHNISAEDRVQEFINGVHDRCAFRYDHGQISDDDDSVSKSPKSGKSGNSKLKKSNTKKP